MNLHGSFLKKKPGASVSSGHIVGSLFLSSQCTGLGSDILSIFLWFQGHLYEEVEGHNLLWQSYFESRWEVRREQR